MPQPSVAGVVEGAAGGRHPPHRPLPSRARRERSV